MCLRRKRSRQAAFMSIHLYAASLQVLALHEVVHAETGKDVTRIFNARCFLLSSILLFAIPCETSGYVARTPPPPPQQCDSPRL